MERDRETLSPLLSLLLPPSGCWHWPCWVPSSVPPSLFSAPRPFVFRFFKNEEELVGGWGG